MKKLLQFLIPFLLAAQAGAGTYPLFAPATGVLKGNTNTYVTTAAANADVISMWSGTCNSTTFLRGDGACITPAGGSPGGSTNQIQYNNGGAFAGSANLTWLNAFGVFTITDHTTGPAINLDGTSVAPASISWGSSGSTVWKIQNTSSDNLDISNVSGNSILGLDNINSRVNIRTGWDLRIGTVSVCLQNGTNCPASATPGGSTNGDVQYKNGTAFAASDAFSYTESLDTGGGYFPSIMQLGNTGGTTEGALFGTGLLTLSAFPAKLTSGANYFNYLNSGYLQLGAGVTNGGSVTLGAGAAPSSGSGGGLNILAGDAAGTNQTGGTVQVVSGAKTGSGTNGDITFKVGGGGGSTALTLRGNREWLVNGVAGSSGNVLTSGGPGATPTWTAPAGGTPAGSTTQIQFNSAGVFGADADFIWDSTNNILDLGSNPTVRAQSTTGTGIELDIKGGASTTTGNGGLLLLAGGTATDGIGGTVNVTAGNAASGASTRVGGAVNIAAGFGIGAAGFGGGITVTSGQGAASAGTGGNLTMTAGAGGATSGSGGSVVVKGGPGTTLGGGGAATLQGGAGAGGLAGGSSLVQGGSAVTTGGGGPATVQGGTPGTTSGNAGSVLITGGTGVADGNGGSVTITGTNAATSTAANRNGGSVTINLGTATGTGTAGALTVGGVVSTPDSFSGSASSVTGCTVAPTNPTLEARAFGRLVIVTIGTTISCTSNSANFFIDTAIPAALRPASAVTCGVLDATDNGSRVGAYITADTGTAGRFIFSKSGSPSWTASGSKLINTAATCSYIR